MVDDPTEAAAYEAALTRGMRLFSLYVAAGGALCLRQATWRKLMPALHPDKGGHTRVFQRLSELKRRIDSGEDVALPALPPIAEGEEAEPLYERVRAELVAAAESAGGMVADRLRELL